jgi:imidazolonepropionase-like amidohydrolase
LDVLGKLYVVSRQGGKARLLTKRDLGWVTGPRVSPDGKRIAFISDLDGGARNAYVLELASGNVRQLTRSDRSVVRIAWVAHSGKLIATRSLISQRGSNAPLVTDNSDPGFSVPPIPGVDVVDAMPMPDGQTVWLTVLDRSKDYSDTGFVSLIEYDMSTWEKTGAVLRDGFAAQTSRNGGLYFVRRREGLTDLWLRRADGTEVRRGQVKFDDLLNSAISSYPNGVTTGYQVDRQGRRIVHISGGRLWELDLRMMKSVERPFEIRQAWSGHALPAYRNPTLVQRILASAGCRRPRQDASFSPDGTFAATIVDDGERVAVRVNRADQEEVWQSPLSDHVSQPSWSPYGRWLTFVSSEDGHCASGSGQADNVCRAAIHRIAFQRGNPKAMMDVVEVPARSLPPVPGATTDIAGTNFMALRDPADGSVFRIQAFPVGGGTQELFAFKVPPADNLQAVAISPDRKWLAVAARDQLFVRKLPSRAAKVQTISVYDGAQVVGQPTSDALKWTATSRLQWNEGDHVVTFDATNGQISRSRVQLAPCQPESGPALALVNARIITEGPSGVIGRGFVIVRNGMIENVGAGTPLLSVGTRVMDLGGRTLVPGFIDTHGHPHLGEYGNWGHFGSLFRPYLANIAYGITTIFDPQADTQTVKIQSERVEAGQMLGPRILSTGTAIFGKETNLPSWAAAPDDLGIIVNHRFLSGMAAIKSYLVDRRDWRQRIVGEAARHRLPVATEGGGDLTGQLTHIADGVRFIEHNFPQGEVHDDVVQYVVQTGVTYTPVLVASTCLSEGTDFFPAISPKDPRWALQTWLDRARESARRDIRPDDRCILGSVQTVRRMMRAGGNVTVASHGERQGLSFQWEMQLWQRGGISPPDILRAATLGGAVKLGIDSVLGSVEKGKVADLVVLNSDPLSDIGHAAGVAAVFLRGRCSSLEDILRAAGVKSVAAATLDERKPFACAQQLASVDHAIFNPGLPATSVGRAGSMAQPFDYSHKQPLRSVKLSSF